MPEEVAFRRRGNAVLAIGWPALVLVGLASMVVGNLEDLTSAAMVAIGGFAVVILAFGASILAVGYLPCLRLGENELVIENIFSRVRLAWPLVAGVERGGDLGLRSMNAFERYQSRGGFAIRDREGGVHHVGAFRYGIMPVAPGSRLLARAEAAVNERRTAFEPEQCVIVERPWGRLAVLAGGPVLIIVGMLAIPILVA